MTKVALFDAHGGSISSHVWLYRKILPIGHVGFNMIDNNHINHGQGILVIG